MSKTKKAAGGIALAVLLASGLIASVRGISSVRRRPAARQGNAAVNGGVEGTVLDSEGQPISGATLILSKFNASKGFASVAQSDDAGRFRFEQVTPGSYKVSGSKPEEGIPDNDFNFFSTGIELAPIVSVIEGRVVEHVVVRLGPKAEKLKGRVWDAATGKRINDAQITMRRADNPRVYFMTNLNVPGSPGSFELLTPQFPVIIEITAPDHDRWRYKFDPPGSRSDQPQQGTHTPKELSVPLHALK